MTTFIRVRTVTPRDGWILHITFTNAEERDIDLWPYIAEGAIFTPLRTDPAYFRDVTIAGGTITWANGADIDPDVLYYGGEPPWAGAHGTQATGTAPADAAHQVATGAD